MKKLLQVFIAAVLTLPAAAGLCAAQQGGPGQDKNAYSIKYEWPKKPKVGDYTLKVNVYDKYGKAARDVEVIASYDMPSMRGHHAAREKMKLSSKGYFLLPIHFAMRGDWEIILSVQKDGKEAVSETILLDI
jgi:hypothetical protein